MWKFNLQDENAQVQTLIHCDVVSSEEKYMQNKNFEGTSKFLLDTNVFYTDI